MRKIPLKYYFIALVGIIILIVVIMLGTRLVTNHLFVNAYNKGEYETEAEEKLLNMNFPESYLPYYNLGNVAYKKGDYNSAIGYYNQALQNYPPEDKDCLIRINLALSLCNTIDFYNLDSQEKIDTALFILYKARDVLLENGCATNEGDGHNADAQQLKEDIDAMIEKLKNPDSTSGSDQPQDQPPQEDNENDSSGSGKGGNDREKRIQNELEENKKGALEDRKGQQDDLQKWSDYIGGDEDSFGGDDDSDGSGGNGDEEGGSSGGNNNPW
jgi:tetratricopeptide (TPR) repeat protein